MKYDLLSVMDRCPPFVVYYASHLITGKRLTVHQLVAASGLSHRTFTRIARRVSWKGVKFGVASNFCRACGVDLLQPYQVLKRLEEENRKPDAWADLKGHCRNQMLKHLNSLAAEAALVQMQQP